MKELLTRHPGLEFLQETPEFQERYGERMGVGQRWGEGMGGRSECCLRTDKEHMEAISQVYDVRNSCAERPESGHPRCMRDTVGCWKEGRGLWVRGLWFVGA